MWSVREVYLEVGVCVCFGWRTLTEVSVWGRTVLDE